MHKKWWKTELKRHITHTYPYTGSFWNAQCTLNIATGLGFKDIRCQLCMNNIILNSDHCVDLLWTLVYIKHFLLCCLECRKRKFIPRFDEQTFHPTQFIITLKRKLVLWFVPQKIGIEFSVLFLFFVLLFLFIFIVNE